MFFESSYIETNILHNIYLRMSPLYSDLSLQTHEAQLLVTDSSPINKRLLCICLCVQMIKVSIVGLHQGAITKLKDY